MVAALRMFALKNLKHVQYNIDSSGPLNWFATKELQTLSCGTPGTSFTYSDVNELRLSHMGGRTPVN